MIGLCLTKEQYCVHLGQQQLSGLKDNPLNESNHVIHILSTLALTFNGDMSIVPDHFTTFGPNVSDAILQGVDENTEKINIPYNIQFYGNAYDHFSVSSFVLPNSKKLRKGDLALKRTP